MRRRAAGMRLWLVAGCRSPAPTHPSAPLALPGVWPPLPAPAAHVRVG